MTLTTMDCAVASNNVQLIKIDNNMNFTFHHVKYYKSLFNIDTKENKSYCPKKTIQIDNKVTLYSLCYQTNLGS
jgi:uncharacterized protein (UPF0305 family)